MKPIPPECGEYCESPGSLVLKLLLDNRNGATVKDIMRHLKTKEGNYSEGTYQKIQDTLEQGIKLGLIEKKDFDYDFGMDDGPQDKCCPRPKKKKKRCPKPKKRRRKPKPCCCKPKKKKPKPCCCKPKPKKRKRKPKPCCC